MGHDLDEEAREGERLLLECFVQLETPEGFRAEFVEGRILVSPLPSGNHEFDFGHINGQLSRQAAKMVYISAKRGLVLPRGDRRTMNYLIPDMVIVLDEPDFGTGSWMPPDAVAMVTEITSPPREDIDREVKRRGYAKGGIPLYLLVDREVREVALFSDPDPGAEDYLQDVRVPFGKPVDLPEPFEFALDTSRFA